MARSILSTWNMFVKWMDEYMSNIEDNWDEKRYVSSLESSCFMIFISKTESAYVKRLQNSLLRFIQDYKLVE